MTEIYKTKVNEFAPASETVTAALDTEMITGERVRGSVFCGFYQNESREDMELWIEQEGQRVHIHASALPALIQQLRRTSKIALAAAKENK